MNGYSLYRIFMRTCAVLLVSFFGFVSMSVAGPTNAKPESSSGRVQMMMMVEAEKIAEDMLIANGSENEQQADQPPPAISAQQRSENTASQTPSADAATDQ